MAGPSATATTAYLSITLFVMPAPKDPAKRELWRQRIGEASRRRPPPSAETLRKRGIAISKAKTGKSRPDMRGDGNPMRRPEVAAQFRGPRNTNYAAVPSYGSLHNRLDYQRGRATTHDCEVCGAPARQWALSHEAEEVVADERGRRYSLTLSDYLAMCQSCHIRYDRFGLHI